jgi:hypothetical protein
MAGNLFSTDCISTFFLGNTLYSISAYPGKIRFGTYSFQNYVDTKYFEFGIFDIYKLYLSLEHFIEFIVTDHEIEQTKHMIFQKSEDEIYFWSGHNVVHNSEHKRIIKIGIEFRTVVTFDIEFDLTSLQLFVFALRKVILHSFSLSDKQYETIEAIISLSLNEIEELQNKKVIFVLLNKLVANNEIKFNSLLEIKHASDFVEYYFETILILKKMELMFPHPREKIFSILR